MWVWTLKCHSNVGESYKFLALFLARIIQAIQVKKRTLQNRAFVRITHPESIRD